MDEKPTRPLTPAQQRFLEAAERIRLDRPTPDDLAYMARELVQVTLPHRNPGNVPEWRRSNGNLTLSIRSGWTTDQKTGQGRPIGYPFGNLPRLLLFWLTAEAVAAKGRGDHSGRIELGSSLSDFMFQLGLNTDSGSVGAKRSDARRLREQMQRLFAANISFEQAIVGDGRWGEHRVNMTVASESMLWWSPQDPHQAALWGSWVELSKKFFDAVVAHPIPLDMRALKALKQSPLALDLYSWVTYEAYRAHRSGKGRFVAWRLLAQQMGTDYADVHDFQRKARAALRKILAVYPALKLGPLRGGIRIEPSSLPAITRDLLGGSRESSPPETIADAAATSLATPEQFAELRHGLSGEARPDSLPAIAPRPTVTVEPTPEPVGPPPAAVQLLEAIESDPTIPLAIPLKDIPALREQVARVVEQLASGGEIAEMEAKCSDPELRRKLRETRETNAALLNRLGRLFDRALAADPSRE